MDETHPDDADAGGAGGGDGGRVRSLATSGEHDGERVSEAAARLARVNQEKLARATEFIEETLQEELSQPFDVALQDGQVLCRVANAIKPGAVAKVSTSRMAFHQLLSLIHI